MFNFRIRKGLGRLFAVSRERRHVWHIFSTVDQNANPGGRRDSEFPGENYVTHLSVRLRSRAKHSGHAKRLQRVLLFRQKPVPSGEDAIGIKPGQFAFESASHVL